MIYKYLKGFSEFYPARQELELSGVVFNYISTIDNQLQVDSDNIIEHPDFLVVEYEQPDLLVVE